MDNPPHVRAQCIPNRILYWSRSVVCHQNNLSNLMHAACTWKSPQWPRSLTTQAQESSHRPSVKNCSLYQWGCIKLAHSCWNGWEYTVQRNPADVKILIFVGVSTVLNPPISPSSKSYVGPVPPGLYAMKYSIRPSLHWPGQTWIISTAWLIGMPGPVPNTGLFLVIDWSACKPSQAEYKLQLYFTFWLVWN